jgi:hypothetical protein
MENKEGPWLNDWSTHDLYDEMAASYHEKREIHFLTTG